MILKFKVNSEKGLKTVYVPKVRGRYIEWVSNLGIYVRTKNPHKATRFSTKEKARKAVKEYGKTGTIVI